MTWSHIIRAACTIADDDELIIVGNQSVLGQYPEAPDELTLSNKADVYPRNHPERWELVDDWCCHRARGIRKMVPPLFR